MSSLRATQFVAAVLLAACGSVASAAFTPGSLVAYWPMDETNASETTLADASGNANDGTLKERKASFPEIAGPTVETGVGPTVNSVVKNNAAFDGTNDILVLDETPSLNFDRTQGSIAFWLKTDLNRRAILRCEKDGKYTGPALEQTGSTGSYAVFFTPNVDEGTFFMTNHAPVAGTWEHYVCVWDYSASDSGDPVNPNRAQIYVNGALTTNHTGSGLGTGDTTFTTTPTAQGNWCFGSRFYDGSTTQRWFAGGMAEIAIYDKALSPSEVSDIYSNGVNAADADLISYQDFSEGPGATSFADQSGNGNTMHASEPLIDFSTIGTPGWAAAWATGKPSYISRALTFDGYNDAAIVPETTSLDFDKSQGTITMWTYFNGSVPRTGIIGSDNGELVAQVSSSARLAYNASPDANNLYLVPTSNPEPANTWVHLAFVFDKSQPASGDGTAPNKVKVYSNGVLLPNTSAASSNPDGTFVTAALTTDWVLGRRHDLADTTNPRWLNGQMADVAIFDTALDQTDIQDIYTNGVAAFTTPPDTDKPTSSGSISVDAQVGATVNVDFTADDGAGSGVASTALWVKTPSSGSFADSGLSLSGASGTFNYTATDGNGLYQFYTVATDNNSNVEDAPAATDDEIAVSLIDNSAVTLPFSSTHLTRTFPMEGGINVTVTFAGVTTDGELTVSRTLGNNAPAGFDASFLIGQQIVISVPGGLAGTGVTLQFDYNDTILGSSITEGDILYVFADDAGSVTPYTGGDVAIDTGANTITISNLSSFSTWYAGSYDATAVHDWKKLND